MLRPRLMPLVGCICGADVTPRSSEAMVRF
jgi:hypothetical protein